MTSSFRPAIATLVFLFSGSLLPGCGGAPQRKVIHVTTCKYNLQSCHIRARNTCASGYSMQSKDRIVKTGGPWGRYTEYSLRYTCR